MTENSIDTTERRGGTAGMIGKMLAERSQLLALLLQASALKQENGTDPDREIVNEFCQLLVDYIASGHFSLYERIVEGTERRKGVAELAVKLYPHIEATTQAALAFNEKYDADHALTDITRFHEELSALGEQLTSRIEYEDRLIRKLAESRKAMK